jgi:hypothetical protein
MLDYDEKRKQLLSEHEVLRVLLSYLRAAAAQALEGSPLGGARLRASLVPLRAAFELHLGREEAALSPILERLDAWGPLRVQRMREEHERQRAAFEGVARDAALGADDARLAQRALELVTAVLADMDAEERDLFDPALHDDPGVSDYLGA